MLKIRKSNKNTYNLFQLEKRDQNKELAPKSYSKNNYLPYIFSFLSVKDLYNFCPLVCKEWLDAVFGGSIYDVDCALHINWNVYSKEISNMTIKNTCFVQSGKFLGLRYGKDKFVFKYAGASIYPLPIDKQDKLNKDEVNNEIDGSFLELRQAYDTKGKYDDAIRNAIMVAISQLSGDDERSDHYFSQIVTAYIRYNDMNILHLGAITLANMNLSQLAIKLVSMEEVSRKRNALLKLCMQYFLEKKQPDVARLFLEKINFLRDEDYIPIVKMGVEYGQPDLVAKVLDKMKANPIKSAACRMAATMCSKKKNEDGKLFFQKMEKEYKEDSRSKTQLFEQQRM